ncbi:MAG TPA: hypothetical protein VFD92_04600 [Candidatus Binatia bacterium]|nr:hypothetical protein [Candidatus Binatia bacterium]
MIAHVLRAIFAVLVGAGVVAAAVAQGGVAQGGRTGDQKRGVLAKDWCQSSLTVMCQPLEEDTTATRVNVAPSGSNYNLTPNGSISRDGTLFVEGSYSNVFPAAPMRYLSCTDATCSNLDFSGAFSAGAAFRSTLLGQSHVIMGKWNNSDGTGWALVVGMTTLGKVQSFIGNTTDQHSTVLASGRWYELGMSFSGSVVKTYVDGSGTSGTSATITTNSLDFEAGDDGRTGTGLAANLDILWAASVNMSAAGQCRVASCGYRNQYGCLCDAGNTASFLFKGRNADAGGCTLPGDCYADDPA